MKALPQRRERQTFVYPQDEDVSFIFKRITRHDVAVVLGDAEVGGAVADGGRLGRTQIEDVAIATVRRCCVSVTGIEADNFADGPAEMVERLIRGDDQVAGDLDLAKWLFSDVLMASFGVELEADEEKKG